MALLINQLDEHNESGIIYLIKNKIEEVLFLYDTEQVDLMKSIREYYSSNFSDIKLYEEIVTEGNIDGLRNILKKYKQDDMVINLTGGKRINSLILLSLCKESKIKCFYTDIRKKFIYSFNEQLLKVNEEIEDLNLLSIIKGFGGNIVDDSYELCLKDDLIYFSKQIYNNLDLWNKHKQKLYDKSIFLHEENNPEIINIDYSRIEDEERNLLDLILNKMKEMNEIAFSKNNDKVKVRFLNNYIKGFIFKSGTWLEIATNNLLKNIKEIDESKHKKLTGWSNLNILDMAKYLSEINKPVWIRHVLVPGGSDNDEELIRLNEFIKTLSNVDRVEVIPYHDLGIFKWEKLGIAYPLINVKPPTKERVENAKKLLYTSEYRGYLSR